MSKLDRVDILYATSDIDSAIMYLAHSIISGTPTEPDFPTINLVGILKGGVYTMFMLLNNLRSLQVLKVNYGFVGVSSYEEETYQVKEPELTYPCDLNVEGKLVWLIDDVYDQGHTIKFAKQHLLECGAKEVKSIVLVTKKPTSEVDAGIYHVTGEFLVGCGMGFGEDLRNLPYIGSCVFAKES